MTGSYPLRVDQNFGVYFPNSSTGMNPSEVTLPELLKMHGYSTCMAGKWHLGDKKDFLPSRHGFDEYLGVLYSNDMWSGNYRSQGWPDFNLISGEETLASYTTKTGGTITSPINTASEQSHLLEAFTEKVVDFIAQEHTAGNPFFVYFAPHAPHTPCYPHPNYDDLTGLGAFYDTVVELDARVGQILAKLDELDITDDTLVIFTSDNGPWVTRYGGQRDENGTLKRNLPENAVGSAYPFRGYKHETWEGGQRVPFLARFPGVIPAGTITDEVAAHFDLYTTIAAWAGVTLPSDGRVIDGKDIRPILAAQSSATSPHDFFLFYDSGKTSPDAILDDNWKLRSNRLYNLSTDIQESSNASSSNPSVVSTLESKMISFNTSLNTNKRSRVNNQSLAIEMQSDTVTVSENGVATVSIRLSRPANSIVTVSKLMGDPDLSIQGSDTLSFNSSNWSQWQTVTFAAASDTDNENGGAIFRANATSANLREIFVREADSKKPGVAITESGGMTVVSEGGVNDSYDVKLTLQPAANVTVTLSPDIELIANGSAGPTELVFTSDDWNRPQTVTVSAIDDFRPEGNHSGSIAHTTSSADPDYDALSIDLNLIQISDDDSDPGAPNSGPAARSLKL